MRAVPFDPSQPEKPMNQTIKSVLSRRALGATALTVILGLGACASLQPSTPEQEVTQRAQDRWAALIKRDFNHAYSYLTPSFRAVVPAADYRKRFGDAGAWTNAIVHKVDCEAESCKVTIRVTSQVRVPLFATQVPETTTYLDEVWVREDGQWWRYEAL